MARLLRSNIQDFVQEVPVGQMAQGTPFRCLPWPTPFLYFHGQNVWQEYKGSSLTDTAAAPTSALQGVAAKGREVLKIPG